MTRTACQNQDLAIAKDGINLDVCARSSESAVLGRPGLVPQSWQIKTATVAVEQRRLRVHLAVPARLRLP
jgi:hypothetical protein